jgi:hypothetical protein
MKITITFQADGSSKTETYGFVGASCKNATEFLQRELGHGQTKHKAEFYQSLGSEVQLKAKL